jgi:hypothetical protein
MPIAKRRAVLDDQQDAASRWRRGQMVAFRSRSKSLAGHLSIPAGIEDTFILFSPSGERRWVPEWEPEFLDPPEPGWRENQVFRTREESGEAVWVVSRLDRDHHEVTYHRIEPGRYVATITVHCKVKTHAETDVFASYSYLGLSEVGNREIDAMQQENYEKKMISWERWIRRYLSDSSPAPAKDF